MLSFATRAALTLALVGSTATVAAAQTFTDLSYNSPTNPNFPATQTNSHNCLWNGQAIGPNYAGATWSGFSALDLRDYLFSGGQTSWGRCFVSGRHGATGLYNGVGPLQSLTGYQQQYASFNPAVTNVVAIGSAQATMRREAPFTLESMLVGAGWGNVSNLRVTGWLGGSQVWFRDFSFLGTGGATQTFGMAGLIDELRFAATYDMGNFMDPYNSASEQVGYGIENPNPYRTFFIDNVTTVARVPEPASLSLIAVGMAGLVGVARRRRRNG
jgi:hypothetical protein